MMYLQRILPSRLQELGRIRLGDQVPLPNKTGTRPRRLDAFRLTSTNKPRLEAAATLWGGTVRKWEDATSEKSWELYTDKDTLPVVVPPFHALSQANEIWQGSECRLRCDGETILTCVKDERRVGQPCACAKFSLKERLEKAKKGEACQTMTRLSLILPDLPGVGVWRLDTGSYYAGMELQGNTALLEQASAEGCYIECALQLEERRVVRQVGGKSQTQVFSVVTLQPQVSMRQLLTRAIPVHALVTGPQEPLAIRGPHLVEELYGDRQSVRVGREPVPERVDRETGEIVEETFASIVALSQESLKTELERTAAQLSPANAGLREACYAWLRSTQPLAEGQQLLDDARKAIGEKHGQRALAI
jgi:Recombination directionality factor-like